MKKKAFLIIGAGTFGRHLCRCMAAQGAELMVVDQNPARLEELLPLSVSAKIGDCTIRRCCVPSACRILTPALSAWAKALKTAW